MSVCVGGGDSEIWEGESARQCRREKRGGSVWKASSRSSAYVGVGAHVCVLLLLWSLAC